MADIKQLEAVCLRNRRRIVDMVHAAGVGHVGGSLSVIDVLTAIYETDVDLSESPRARVVLSKGHVTPALYAELTEENGQLPHMSEESDMELLEGDIVRNIAVNVRFTDGWDE